MCWSFGLIWNHYSFFQCLININSYQKYIGCVFYIVARVSADESLLTLYKVYVCVCVTVYHVQAGLWVLAPRSFLSVPKEEEEKKDYDEWMKIKQQVWLGIHAASD